MNLNEAAKYISDMIEPTIQERIDKAVTAAVEAERERVKWLLREDYDVVMTDEDLDELFDRLFPTTPAPGGDLDTELDKTVAGLVVVPRSLQDKAKPDRGVDRKLNTITEETLELVVLGNIAKELTDEIQIGRQVALAKVIMEGLRTHNILKTQI